MPRLPEKPEDFKMSLGEHLEELRMRLILALGGVVGVGLVCFIFGGRLVAFVVEPVKQAVEQIGGEGTRLVILTPTEAFMTTLKTSLLAGLVISSPWVFYQMWRFVGAGLYRHERRVVEICVPFSALLFIAGTIFSYKIVLTYGLRFLMGFGGLTEKIAAPTIHLSAAVSFVTMMAVVMGAVFQLPLVMMVLAKIGIISTRTYTKYWRHSVAGMFLAAALLTPPDPFTQVMMAGPLIGLYWLGVLLSWLVSGRKAARETVN